MTDDEVPDAAVQAFKQAVKDRIGTTWNVLAGPYVRVGLRAALRHLVAKRDAQNCDALIAILSAHAGEWRSRGEKSAAVGVETAIDKVRAFYINAALEKPHG